MEYWAGHAVAGEASDRDRDAEFRGPVVDDLAERARRPGRNSSDDLAHVEPLAAPPLTVSTDAATWSMPVPRAGLSSILRGAGPSIGARWRAAGTSSWLRGRGSYLRVNAATWRRVRSRPWFRSSPLWPVDKARAQGGAKGAHELLAVGVLERGHACSGAPPGRRCRRSDRGRRRSRRDDRVGRSRYRRPPRRTTASTQSHPRSREPSSFCTGCHVVEATFRRRCCRHACLLRRWHADAAPPPARGRACRQRSKGISCQHVVGPLRVRGSERGTSGRKGGHRHGRCRGNR